MRFRTKPHVVEAITFDELLAHGIAQSELAGQCLTNGMPWSFSYAGHAITHEHDNCYLIPTLDGVKPMTRDDMLVTGPRGEIFPLGPQAFQAAYEPMVLTEGDALADLNGTPRPDHPTYKGQP